MTSSEVEAATIEFSIHGTPSPWANEEIEVRWRQAIAAQVPPKAEIPSGAIFEVELEFRLDPRRLLRSNDLDNLAKPVLDTLFTQARRSTRPARCSPWMTGAWWIWGCARSPRRSKGCGC